MTVKTPKKTAAPRPARKPAARKTTTAKATATAAAAAPKRVRARKQAPNLVEVAVAALQDMKGHNIKVLDVTRLTDVADNMIIATGTSDRHVKSLARHVLDKIEAAGFRALGIEGEGEGEWVLVDLQDAIVHVMLPRIREFYGLEKLWEPRAATREPASA
jgi:ribosome-associated protein